MEAYDIKELLEMFSDKPEIFVCGPNYGDTSKPPKTKLRVYAHGGVLCELPTKPRTEITLLDKKYLPKDSPLLMTFGGLRGNEQKERFLQDHLSDLLSIMRDRFTSKKGVIEERNQQTMISRAHADFHPEHDGTVVCDFESSLPKSMGQPNFDLVTFSMDKTGDGVFTLVEYKCSACACRGENGLAKHAADMLNCINNSAMSDWCKQELLRRLGYMCRYDLLKNCPDELERLRPEDTKLRAAFLFTRGDGLQSREDAAALCRAYIPEADLDEFSYRYAEGPEKADLSKMVRWNEFKEG